MQIAVIRFPGTNNEYETLRALQSFDEVDAELLEYKEINRVDEFDGFWLAGGFSFADVLRAGAIASQTEMITEIAATGQPVLGVCNGFQILTEASLLPGALMPNDSTRFICKWIYLKVSDHPAFQEVRGKVLKLPIAHFEGKLYTDELPDVYDFVRYSDKQGNIRPEVNPNGSDDNIAGAITKNHQFMGLMPHPERASFKHQGSTDGRLIIESFLTEVKQ